MGFIHLRPWRELAPFFAALPLWAAEPESSAPGGLGGSDAAGAADAEEAAARYADPAWRLIWHDEFDGPSPAPDPAKWTYEHGLIRNREAQFYTVDRRENARVEDGQLVVVAHREPWESAAYTSASLTTEGLFAMRYGKIEIRARVPGGRGTWPAWWMLGTSHRVVGWPLCVEIDLMEHVGFAPDRVHFTVHTAAYNHTRGTHRGTSIVVPDAAEAFHRYGLIWSPERLEWFFNGEKVFAFANEGTGPEAWPFDEPHYLIVNLAIGGAWGGQRGIDETVFPAEFRVDYVRVWER